MISRGTKVHVEIGRQVLPAVVVEHHFASTRVHDLYMLRVAEYSQTTQRWQISGYGPVSSRKLTKRETRIPGLDRDEEQKRRRVPEWVRQLHR